MTTETTISTTTSIKRERIKEMRRNILCDLKNFNSIVINKIEEKKKVLLYR